MNHSLPKQLSVFNASLIIVNLLVIFLSYAYTSKFQIYTSIIGELGGDLSWLGKIAITLANHYWIIVIVGISAVIITIRWKDVYTRIAINLSAFVFLILTFTFMNEFLRYEMSLMIQTLFP